MSCGQLAPPYTWSWNIFFCKATVTRLCIMIMVIWLVGCYDILHYLCSDKFVFAFQLDQNSVLMWPTIHQVGLITRLISYDCRRDKHHQFMHNNGKPSQPASQPGRHQLHSHDREEQQQQKVSIIAYVGWWSSVVSWGVSNRCKLKKYASTYMCVCIPIASVCVLVCVVCTTRCCLAMFSNYFATAAH